MPIEGEVPTNAIQSIPNSDITSGGVVLKLGTNYLWADSTGDLRINGSNPTGDTDGTIVGNQS